VWLIHREGQQIRGYKSAWNSACKAANLEERLFHDLRRTGVRNLIWAGVPERVAMMISCHNTQAVFDLYNIVSDEDLKDAARKQDAALACRISDAVEKIRKPSKRIQNPKPLKIMVPGAGLEPARPSGQRILSP
jgi:hypothetical protein